MKSPDGVRPAHRDAYLWAVVVVQAIACVIAFRPILFHPSERTLYADYDGVKNYFTPYSYLTRLGEDRLPPGDEPHAVKVYGQHFPFGEYIFYTDATPAVAVPARALGWPTVAGGVGLLSYVIVAFQWAAAAVLYLLLRQAMRTRWLAALFAVATVWGAKQYWHLTMGSPNLSLLPFTLGLLGILWRLYGQPRAWRWWLASAGLIAAASFFHLYYLLIYGTALALFAAAVVALAWRSGGGRAAGAVAARAAAAGLLAVGIVYLTVALVDDKLALRTGEHLGYGFEGWRLDVRSLITPHPEQRQRFIVSRAEKMFGEPAAYLGLWWWYAVLLGALIAVGTRYRLRDARRVLREHAFGRYLLALGVVGTLCFFAALGTSYRLPDSEWTWSIYLNPFYPFVKHSVALQQFRATARFFFITQWAWSLPVLLLLDRLWRVYPLRRGGGWAVRLGVLVVILAAVLDAVDVIRAANRGAHRNPLGEEATATWRAALAGIDLSDYQALLVAPYYHVGSQEIGLIADPPNPQVQREVFGLSAATQLPLLNAITSRTPPHEVRQLMTFVESGRPPDSLARGLTGAPLLVAVHRPSAAAIARGEPGGFNFPAGGLARRAVAASTTIAGRPGVDSLTTAGEYTFYRWDWRQAL